MKTEQIIAFVLGILISFSIGYWVEVFDDDSKDTNTERLLDSKLHLMDLKIDIATDQTNETTIQEARTVMDILANSHTISGEGLLAREAAMQEAAKSLISDLESGGANAIEYINILLKGIEKHLHPN